jgi:hypothetical protein
MINIEKLSPGNRHSKELLFNGLPDEYPKLSLKETNNLIKEKITEREIKITPDLI